MKAITLLQPWASLLVCEAKQYETRSWATSYRGPIAIHSAKKPVEKILDDLFPRTEGVTAAEMNFVEAVRSCWEDWIDGEPFHDGFPLGAIIATAELVGCHRIVRYGGRGLSSTSPGWLETDDGIYEPTDQELFFGDWTPGRYAWEFANMKMLDKPIPAKGKQGLWTWEEERSA